MSNYCMIHHQPLSECECSKDILQRIDSAETTMKLAAHEIILLRRDRFELTEALKDLVEKCPADPDTTSDFLKANKRAASLINKFQKQTT